MKITLVLFAIMIFVVLSMEIAGSRKKSPELRTLRSRRQRLRRPWEALRRKITIRKDKRLTGIGKLRKIGDPLPERSDRGIRKNEHYVS